MAKAPTEIKSIARSHTEEAIRTLVGVMRNSTNDNAKSAAAIHLLDRGWGKAVQHTEVEVTRRYVARVPEKTVTSDKWQQQNAPKIH